mmetsp:Transcript_49754/g.128389  ORF Transcript_49754/g.128389 Transcript_49754/m.128389 type:complete len:205 (+) Transcript_49754:315-929(+)
MLSNSWKRRRPGHGDELPLHRWWTTRQQRQCHAFFTLRCRRKAFEKAHRYCKFEGSEVVVFGQDNSIDVGVPSDEIIHGLSSCALLELCFAIALIIDCSNVLCNACRPQILQKSWLRCDNKRLAHSESSQVEPASVSDSRNGIAIGNIDPLMSQFVGVRIAGVTCAFRQKHHSLSQLDQLIDFHNNVSMQLCRLPARENIQSRK